MTRSRARSRLYASLQALDLRLSALHLDEAEAVVGDAADQHTALQAREETTGERGRLAEQRRQVVAALIRLEERTYGECLSCLQPIPAARLEAQPAAARCVPCEARRETETRAGGLLDMRPADYGEGEETP